MNSAKIVERKIVTTCYDHLGGILGELIFNFFLKEKLIEKSKVDNEYIISGKGWNELEIFGIDVKKLRSSKRKIVTICYDTYYGIYDQHIGAHLGAVLKDWFFELGWVVINEKKIVRLTKKGLHGLKALGVDTEIIMKQL